MSGTRDTIPVLPPDCGFPDAPSPALGPSSAFSHLLESTCAGIPIAREPALSCALAPGARTGPRAPPPMTRLSAADIETLAFDALRAAGAPANAAGSVARSVVHAEAHGIASHGLAYVPIYCEHLRCGKVRREARPVVERTRPGLIRVDADCGFAHPAIDLGFVSLVPAAREQGIAACAVRNSYNCGVLAFHTNRLAREGLLALGFTHAPASIAPTGGNRPLVGTNPIAMAVPDGNGGIAFSIDQSASVIAKSEIMKHKREGKPIPDHWAFDAEGNPTTDPGTALDGSMAPSGGYKGVGIALIVETLAAAAAGAVLSREASPFAGPAGGPPRTGQFFIAIDTRASSGGVFNQRIATLVEAIGEQPGARLPGARRGDAFERTSRGGVEVADELIERIRAA